MSESKSDRFTQMYETGVTPWELNRPDNNLKNWVKTYPIKPCRALDLGCGTGSNAIWLTTQGFEVTGADFSPPAIEKAKEKASAAGVEILFTVKDFLSEKIEPNNFSFVFDRGCFHSFDNPKERSLFAQNAHDHMAPNGLWLSFLGSTDAPPREEGPPMRSALDIAQAVEPWFEIRSLTAAYFDSEREKPAPSWHCLMRKRAV